jgi:hypothetical protein
MLLICFLNDFLAPFKENSLFYKPSLNLVTYTRTWIQSTVKSWSLYSFVFFLCVLKVFSRVAAKAIFIKEAFQIISAQNLCGFGSLSHWKAESSNESPRTYSSLTSVTLLLVLFLFNQICSSAILKHGQFVWLKVLEFSLHTLLHSLVTYSVSEISLKMSHIGWCVVRDQPQ